MCHALIIEDEFLTAELLTVLAQEGGATSVATASTEAEAICAARECQPNIIISDVRLAAGTGPAAVQTIMAETGEVPVIFITGTPEECAPCAPPGVIMTKPVNQRVLVDMFRQLVA